MAWARYQQKQRKLASFILLTDAMSMCDISVNGEGYLHKRHVLCKATFSNRWTAQVILEVHPKAAFLNQSASSKLTRRYFPELHLTIYHPKLSHCVFSVGCLAKLQITYYPIALRSPCPPRMERSRLDHLCRPLSSVRPPA